VTTPNCNAIGGPGKDPYCDAVFFAERREILYLAAAGNQNNVKLDSANAYATQFPASEPTVISIGGLVLGDNLWENDPISGASPYPAGSNTDKVEFYAGAKSVISTFYRTPPYYDMVWFPTWCTDSGNNAYLQALGFGSLGQGYDECTGTSMSTPLVAGSLALLRSINPLKSRSALVGIATASARSLSGGKKTPDLLAGTNAVMATNGSLTPLFALAAGSTSNRFYTVFPQMASAAVWGTMLPLANQSTTLVPYVSDGFAKAIPNIYLAFPDTTQIARADFLVYTRDVVSGITMLPLRRLSKPQNIGNGKDRCGFAMPAPSKIYPVLHTYATSSADLAMFMNSTAGNCFDYDGIEGFVAPTNWSGNLVALYRLYNGSNDTYILVPQTKVAAANAAGYTLYQTLLGYVEPT